MHNFFNKRQDIYNTQQINAQQSEIVPLLDFIKMNHQPTEYNFQSTHTLLTQT